MRSWDVFDTLIGRRCFDNRGIFEIMAERIGDASFVDVRARADQMSPGLDAIYENVAQQTGRTPEQIESLKRLELEVEKEQAYIIPENCDQVEDGDVLVSDMYFGKSGVGAILAHVGFNKKTRLHVESHGKMTGAVWDTLRALGLSPQVHTGDNFHSDVVSPTRQGIVGRHYNTCFWSPFERLMSDAGYRYLSRLMRTTRLMNPYLPGTLPHGMWNEQAQVNGPLLYLASLHLHHFHRQRQPFSTVLFPTRDACHWHRLFGTLFPDQKIVYFQTSRKLFQDPTPQYVAYIASLGDLSQAVIADCHGTGRSVYKYFSTHTQHMPYCYMISSMHSIAPMIALQRFYALSGATNINIEKPNYDTVGALVDYTDAGPVREPPAYNAAFLEPYHRAIGCFIQECKRSKIDVPLDEKRLIEIVRSLVALLNRATHIDPLIEIDWGHLEGTFYEHAPSLA